jgi:hypothetical protein
MLCPKCGGSKVVDNKEFRKTSTRGIGHVAKNHPVVAAVGLAAWLAMKAIDAASHSWKCEDCKHTFS